MRRTLIRLLVAAVTTVALWPWIVRLPPGGIEDDGYFYALIAYNAGVHGLLSFDGIHPTDGFHQLWGRVLAGGSLLLSTVTRSRTAHLYLACLISIAAIALTADRFGRRHSDKFLLLGLGITGTLLMETPLLSLLVLTMVLGSLPPESPSGLTRYALLSMAITPTRLDATIVSVVWALGLAAMGRRRLAAAVLVGVLLGVLIQLGLNWHVTGEWTSVASVIKVDRILATFGQGVFWPRAYLGRHLLLALLLALSLAAVWQHARTTGDRRWLLAWIAMASFSLPHFFAGMRPWYFVPGYLGCVALLISARDDAAPSAKRAARAGLAIAWLGLGAFVVIEVRAGMQYADETAAVVDFVRDLQRIVPAGEPIYQVDGSGYIGFFSERPVVNGDGLVNTHGYAERMRQGRLAGYLDEEHIRFIVTNQPPSGHLVDRGGLVVTSGEVEEVASKRGPVVNRFTNFRLFRRKPSVHDALPSPGEIKREVGR